MACNPRGAWAARGGSAWCGSGLKAARAAFREIRHPLGITEVIRGWSRIHFVLNLCEELFVRIFRDLRVPRARVCGGCVRNLFLHIGLHVFYVLSSAHAPAAGPVRACARNALLEVSDVGVELLPRLRPHARTDISRAEKTRRIFGAPAVAPDCDRSETESAYGSVGVAPACLGPLRLQGLLT